MALNTRKIPSQGSGNRVEQPILEAGVYPARVVQIIDFGLQPQRAYQGRPKPPAYEIQVTYELVDVFMVDEDGNELEDKPRWINETFPIYSLDADMAKSTKRYYALDPDCVHDGDFSKLLGTPCNVTIVLNKKEGRTYENIGNVSAMRPRDADKCPELKNEERFFDLDNPDLEVFNKLPKWIQDKITSNLEFDGSKLDKLLGDAPKEEEEAPKPSRRGRPRKEVEEEEPAFDPDEDDDNNPY